jgi:hypothetical protein
MAVPNISLDRIEHDIDRLSLAEQLLLMERLVRRIRQQTEYRSSSDLSRMAEDPDIQREIAAINAEFAPTENDGLE